MRARSCAPVYVLKHCSKLAAVCCVHCRSRGVIKCSEKTEGAQALARALKTSRISRTDCARKTWAQQVQTCI
eukprot:6212021-Pleurochrysis_carterae.AAC.3